MCAHMHESVSKVHVLQHLHPRRHPLAHRPTRDTPSHACACTHACTHTHAHLEPPSTHKQDARLRVHTNTHANKHTQTYAHIHTHPCTWMKAAHSGLKAWLVWQLTSLRAVRRACRSFSPTPMAMLVEARCARSSRTPVSCSRISVSSPAASCCTLHPTNGAAGKAWQGCTPWSLLLPHMCAPCTEQAGQQARQREGVQSLSYAAPCPPCTDRAGSKRGELVHGLFDFAAVCRPQTGQDVGARKSQQGGAWCVLLHHAHTPRK